MDQATDKMTRHAVQPKRSVTSTVREPSDEPPVEAVQAEIERTRDETVQTINEIQRRLAPATIKAKARQATVGKVQNMAHHTGNRFRYWSSAVFESIRQNPIPAAMVGSGLAWMITSRIRENGEEYEYAEADAELRAGRVYVEPVEHHPDLHYGYDPAEAVAESSRTGEGEVQGGIRETARAFSEKASEIGQKAGDRVAEAGAQIRETADEVRRKARTTSAQLRERARQVSATASEQSRRVRRGGRRAKEGFFQQMEENPLAIAGVAFAVGAAMGFAFPETRPERETLGPLREKVMEQVRETGRETLEKSRKVINEATEAAKAEAERQDLISKETAGKAEHEIRKAQEQFGSGIEERFSGGKVK